MAIVTLESTFEDPTNTATTVISSTSTTSAADVLSLKVARALEVRTDTPAMQTALSALDSLSEKQDLNETTSTKSVRAAIEQDALQQALMLQNELKSLSTTIKSLSECISQVSSSAKHVCDAIESDVVTSSQSSESSSSFEQERNLALLIANAFIARDEALQKSETIRTFLEKFDLTEEDHTILEHYAFHEFDPSASKVGSGSQFLSALQNVKRIRFELQQTFASDLNEMNSASSALRMMESLASKQERAYDRLYRWVQSFLNLGLTAVAHVPTSSDMARRGYHTPTSVQLDGDAMDEALAHPFVRHALVVLKDVPSFHSHTIELISTQRRAEVTKRFLLALTSGPSPIEMKAHDPVVYVGDMLAFVFRSLSVESDLARGLLVAEGEDEENNDALAGEKVMTAMDMVSIAMSGVTRPLKARVSQVISSCAKRPEDDYEEDERNYGSGVEEVSLLRTKISSLYEISGLLLFYVSAVKKSINKLSKEAAHLTLLKSLLECLNEASASYAASLKVYAAMLQSYASTMNDSEAVLANAILVLVADTRLASPGFMLEEEKTTIHANLSLEFTCNTILEAATPLCASLEDVHLLKSAIASCKKAGLQQSIIKSWSSAITTKETKLMDDLIGIETIKVLYKCGIGEIYESIISIQDLLNDQTFIALQPGLHQTQVQPAFKIFNESLFNPPIPTFEQQIKDPNLKKHCRNKTANNVAEAYEKVYNMMKSEVGGYEDLSFLVHDPDQVKTLLSGF